MRLTTLIGLGAVGGFFYVHNRRGGQMTLDSILDTGRSLLETAKQDARQIKDKAVQEVGSKLPRATETH